MERCYVIGMSDNEISRKYLDITIPQIERVTSITPFVWEAVTPSILPNKPLKFFRTKPTLGTTESKSLSSTEMAVWYSHFTLWKHIKENGINSWIFEHDVDLSNVNLLLPYVNDIVTLKCKGCLEAYYLTPFGAKKLYDAAIGMSIYYQVDGFVYNLVESRESFKKIHYSPKLPISQLKMYGTTIDHQPSSATYSDQV